MTAERNVLDFSSQVALVTGAGRGLGRSYALALAEAGAAVAVVARTSEQIEETADLIRQKNGKVPTLLIDITDSEAVERSVEQLEQTLGSVDILINNAGVVHAPGPIWAADPKDWQHTLDVNLHGAFFCSRAVLKHMIPRQSGRIINVASGAARAGFPNGQMYCISKAALVRFTECLALDIQEFGITTFVIDPGTVRTAMSEYLMESEAGRTYIPWFREFMLSGGDIPADVSTQLILFLLSGKADMLSGRFISVWDDINQLVSQAQQIQSADLYTLRLRELPPPVVQDESKINQ